MRLEYESKNQTANKEIIDVDYENFFDASFSETTHNDKNYIDLSDQPSSRSSNKSYNKNEEVTFDEVFESITKIASSVINSAKKQYKDYNIRKKLNFTILDSKELHQLVRSYKSYYLFLSLSIAGIIASCGLFVLADVTPLFIPLALMCLFASIIHLVYVSYKNSQRFGHIVGKSIEFNQTNISWLEDELEQNNRKKPLGIVILLSGIFLPIVSLITFEIIELYFFSLLSITLMFFGIGLGTALITYQASIDNLLKTLLKGKRLK